MDRNRWIRSAAVVFLVLLLSMELAACSSIPGTAQSKPQIKIISPSTGAQVQAGQDVSVQSMATDPNGVKKVELWVDQALVRADELAAQNAGSAAAMAQVWKATSPGSHNLTVIAYNRAGVASEPTWVTVNVVSGPVESPTSPSQQPTAGAGASNCKNAVELVSDVTVPPRTVLAPGQVFVKTWRVRNTGNCTVSNHQLVAIKGETMGVNQQPVPDIPLGQESDISATMVAPNVPGSYEGVWEVSSPEGYWAGPLSCMIIVQGGGAPGPTPTTPISSGAGRPNAPTNLRITGWTGNNANLAFTDNSNNEQIFAVFINGVANARLDANVTTFQIATACDTTYDVYVMAGNETGESAPSNTVRVQRACAGPLPLPAVPNAPNGLTHTMGTNTWHFLDNSNNEDGFRVYVNGRLDRVLGPNVRSFELVLTLSCGATGEVYVTAFNAAGESGRSETARPVGDCAAPPPPSVPNAPSNLRATGAREGQKFQLAFQDNANNETSFVIYINGSPWDKIGPNVTTFWIGVDCGTSSSVYVTAQNPSGESGHSNTVRVDGGACAAPPPAVPNAPSNLRATGAREGQKFQLAFQDNANNETSFVIYINGSPWDKIGPNVTTFWIGVDCGTSSSVYVTAQNPSGESGHSNTVRVDGGACAAPPPSVPNAPSNLRATGAQEGQKFQLAFQDNANNETSFVIYINGSPWDKIGPNVTTFWIGVDCGTSSSVYVTAQNPSGESGHSNTVRVDGGACAAPPPAVPNAPSNLRATGAQEGQKFELVFQDNANNETSFVIYINGSPWDKIGPNVTTFWIGVECGTASDVYVTAQNPSGESGRSNTVRVDGGVCR